MVGECIVEYQKGDIMFFGRNLPHCSSLYEYTDKGISPSESKILQFHPDLFPSKINELTDYRFISHLLLKSQNGLVFRNRMLTKKIESYMDEIPQRSGIAKINSLFNLLEILAKNKNTKQTPEHQFDIKNTFCESYEYLQKLYDYLYRNMKKEINLEDISRYVNTTPAYLAVRSRIKHESQSFNS